MKSVKPWPAGTECPLDGYETFKRELGIASYHNAAEGAREMRDARSAVRAAAEVAIEQKWPYWTMERMFNEISPLVTWGEFMQAYLNIMHAYINHPS